MSASSASGVERGTEYPLLIFVHDCFGGPSIGVLQCNGKYVRVDMLGIRFDGLEKVHACRFIALVVLKTLRNSATSASGGKSPPLIKGPRTLSIIITSTAVPNAASHMGVCPKRKTWPSVRFFGWTSVDSDDDAVADILKCFLNFDFAVVNMVVAGRVMGRGGEIRRIGMGPAGVMCWRLEALPIMSVRTVWKSRSPDSQIHRE